MVKVLDIAENFVSLQRVILVDIAITGYKCVVRIENADNKVDGEMAEYPRKEPESGVCMWSKKCDNANAFCDTTVNPVGGKFFRHDHQTKLLTTEAHKKRTLTK